MKKTCLLSRTILVAGLLGISLYGQQPLQPVQSLYSDIKAHEVGGVVTVLIVEIANASRQSQVNSSAKSDLSVSSSVTGNLTDFLPLFGAGSSMKNEHDGTEGTAQEEQLTGKISATIVEKTEAGLLRIEGERVLDVNGAKNLMRIEGLVRPRDVRADNTVYSYNIADAAITYRKTGLTGGLIKPGSTQKWGTWLLGLIAISLAVTSAS